MKIAEYNEQVLTRLGSPLLDIELETEGNKVLDKIIKSAFFELREYIDTPYIQTLPYSASGMDVSQYKVRAILYVTRGNITLTNAMENTGALLWSPLSTMMNQTVNMGYRYSQVNFMQDYVATLQFKQLRNGLNQDLEHMYDPGRKKLFVFQQIPQAATVTMVYNKILTDVEEIEDPYWQNILLKLSIALSKEVLGRIRSKYKPNSDPFEMDGDTLLSEAREELSEIREMLQQNNNLFIPAN